MSASFAAFLIFRSSLNFFVLSVTSNEIKEMMRPRVMSLSQDVLGRSIYRSVCAQQEQSTLLTDDLRCC